MVVLVRGNSQNNVLVNLLSERVRIEGLGGDDLLITNGNKSHLIGEAGNDILIALGGGSKLNGGSGNDFILGGEGRDTVYGGNGNDFVNSGGGNDRIYDTRDRENNNDVFLGGAGRDRIYASGGADFVNGGEGGDVIWSISDSGEPIPFQDPSALVNSGEPLIDPLLLNDTLLGGKGADRFIINPRLDAKLAIVQKHTDPTTGKIDWQSVAGENDNAHDHWVEGVGEDTILDYNKREGDRIILRGHTVAIKSIQELVDEFGVEFTRVELRSDQGADGQPGGGAHDFDDLGVVNIYGDSVSANDLIVKAGVFDGMYKLIEGYDGVSEV